MFYGIFVSAFGDLGGAVLACDDRQTLSKNVISRVLSKQPIGDIC